MNRRQRKSPRKPGFDYTTDGVYFVTICTNNRAHLFGHIQHGLMCFNGAGGMVTDWWNALPSKFAAVTLHNFVVMPNHTHALIVLEQQQATIALSKVMQWFKTMTTNAYIQGVRRRGWESFNQRLWQRSYHDRIVRNEAEWAQVDQYITSNPALWEADKFYESG